MSGNAIAYGAAKLSRELHACLTCGGGKPGQSYPCALIEGGGDGMSIETFAESSFGNFAEGRIATLKASSGQCGGGSETLVADAPGAVRRLTPLECERLQGFPDGWTDIGAWEDSKGRIRKESADAARYKALGNSIALPPWEFVLQRLSLCCGPDATMASLFDGIGGFPLIWERLNGAGSCLWASEIEEFPLAVTRRRLGEARGDEG